MHGCNWIQGLCEKVQQLKVFNAFIYVKLSILNNQGYNFKYIVYTGYN